MSEPTAEKPIPSVLPLVDLPPAPAPIAVAPPPVPPASPADRPRPKGFPKRDGDRPRPAPVMQSFEMPTIPSVRQLDAQIEAELAAAMAGFDESSLKEAAKPIDPKAQPTGGLKKVRVVAINGADIFVDVPGGRSQGIVSALSFPKDKQPKIGDELSCEIDGFDPANGLLKMAMPGTAQSVDWSSVQVGKTVEARVTAVNKGGLSIEVNGIRGFMPFRELDLYRVEQPEQFIGQRLTCVVQEVVPEERNLVVSRRVLMEKEKERLQEEFWKTIEEGQTRKGTIRNLQPFGAFVELGGADGLIPVSELSWGRVESPEAVVKIGQIVEVKVVRVDKTAKRISLSLKALAASPWDTIRDRIAIGQRITGKVTRVAEFGAFVEVEPGIEGLIHISELGTNRVRRVRDVLQEGREVEVQIVTIDLDQKRIGLSLKAIAETARRAVESAQMEAQRLKEEAEEAEAAAKAASGKPRVRKYELKGGMGGGGNLFPNVGG